MTSWLGPFGRSLHPAARISFALLAAAAFGCSLALACADLLGFTAGNARAWEDRAARLQAEGCYAESRTALEAAVRASPRRSSAWIALGLEREAALDYSAAERCLLEAARVDRTYQPRWTLANFYFRRDDAERFWLWARRAAGMASRDLTPLLALCSRTGADPAEIARRIMPDNLAARRAYMTFLLRAGRPAPAGALAVEIAPRARAEDRPALLDACNAMLAAGDSVRALPVCNAVAPAEPFSSQGFDWRLPAVEGVWAAHDPDRLELRLSLSGAQPANCELLWRYLAPARRHRLEYEAAPPGRGFFWVALSPAGRPLTQSADLADLPAGALLFEGAARLALIYRRVPGSVRAAGELWLRNLKLHSEP